MRHLNSVKRVVSLCAKGKHLRRIMSLANKEEPRPPSKGAVMLALDMGTG